MFWLGRVPLLRRLPPSSLQRLADTCLTLTFETGERIQRRVRLACVAARVPLRAD